jgi:hypothetical protein
MHRPTISIQDFGNIAPLKQWNFHRQFKERCYCFRNLNVCIS